MEKKNKIGYIAVKDIVYYDIEWDKVKTIKDVKLILQVLATKVLIDHNDEEDNVVFETLKKVLVKSDDQEA